MNLKLQGGDVFIVASQATQIYYASSVKDPNSSIYTVITTRGQPIDESTSVIYEENKQKYNGEEEEEEEQEQEEKDRDEEEEDSYENLEEHDV
ncbi:hypothetical protein AgCh_012374 [Apium graveolens]